MTFFRIENSLLKIVVVIFEGFYTTQSKVLGGGSKNIKTLVPQLLKYRHTYFYISIELMVIVLPVNRCADV